MVGEGAGQRGERRGRDPAQALHGLGREVGQAVAPAVDRGAGGTRLSRRASGGHQQVRETERHGALGAGLHRDPAVGAGAGLRHPRFDLHPGRAGRAAHLAEAGGVRQRRVPRAEYVGAEVHDVPGVREIERGQLKPAEADGVGPPQHVVVERLVPDRRRGAKAGEERVDQRGAAPGMRPADPADGLRAAVAGGIDLRGHKRQRFIPRHRGEGAGAAFAGAFHRTGEPVGVIRHLHRRLAASAEPALAHRVRRVAFELLHEGRAHDARRAVAQHLGIAVHHPGLHAAAGRAQRADARLPLGDPGRDHVLGNEAHELVLGAAARRERGGGAGDGGDLQETSAVHRRSKLSSGRSGSRSTPASPCDSSRRRPCSCRRRGAPPPAAACRRDRLRSRPWQRCAARE